MSKHKDKDNSKWSGCALRIIVNTASHPLEFAKVLIQIGYEPIPPRPTTTFFGKPALKLPNIVEYVKHIKSVDGFTGCYRGLVPKVCGNLVSAVASQKIIEKLELETQEQSDGDDDTEENKKEVFFKTVKREFISRTAAIIISHPFHVITIRMMAQFVGRETKYNGIFSSIFEVYKQNGLLGFFNGLLPRILGDVISLILASTLTYFVNSYILEEKELQLYSSATMSFIATAITYPFQVVSNCMAVTGSGLAAGSPDFMPNYTSWVDCWSDLSRRNQLKRGSSLLIRYYVGPQVVISGRAVAVPRDDLLKQNY